MTYSVISIGCQMNQADGERLSYYLKQLGFSRREDFLSADLVVLLTCGVKQAAEDRVYGLVNRISKNNPKTVIAVSGCLSRRSDVLNRLKDQVSICFNISDLPKLNQSLKKYFPRFKRIPRSVKNYLDLPADYSSSFSAFIPIGNGCDNFCSYCVVPYARSREVYRPARIIIREASKLIKNGYKEISLIAQNVNSYRSGNFDFPALLRAVDDLPGDFWLRFSTSHPKDVSDELIKVLKTGRHICEHFHLAVQSGDNDILRAMNRGYRIEDYQRVLRKIRQALAGRNGLPAAISTDVIVGFPGETARNFAQTKKLFQTEKFDLAFIAKYSPRRGTASYNWPDQVSLTEKKKRELELNRLLKKYLLSNNKKYLKREVEVLVEGLNRYGRPWGRTRTSKIVVIADPLPGICSGRELIGQFVRVEINSVREFELRGKLKKYDKKES